MREPIIKAEHLKKEYWIYENNHQKLQHELFGRKVGQTARALEDVSFEIYPGEKVAIIGKKGAGVSTLFKILAEIIIPDEGDLKISGKVDTYFEHRQYFDASLTGRENMRILADIRGIPREELEAHTEEILEFAGAPGMEDVPMKNYPPGSQTRIGFALSTIVKPEILLLDVNFEFGLGKNALCRARLEELVKGKDSTLIMNMTNYLVTKKLCSRGIVLDKGNLIFDGKFVEAVRFYNDHNKKMASNETADNNDAQTERDSEDDNVNTDIIETEDMDM